MTPTLIDEQRQAIDQQGGAPVYVVDTERHQQYVLISASAYQRLRGLFEDEPFDIRETYAAQEAALKEVWDDPELDEYNDYDVHRPKQ
jgi:hypothetical protein